MPATILCAEDDRNLLQIHRRALLAEGYEVIDAQDGERALALLDEKAPDLVLLDLGLSKCDGLEIVERLRGGGSPARTAPVLLLSAGRISPGCQKRIDAAGAIATLSKPVALDDLLGGIGRLVKRARKRAPGAAKKGAAATTTKRARSKDAKSKSAPSGRGASGGAAVSIESEGSLADLDFATLLHRLHVAKTDGTLLVRSGKKKKAIEFRGGYPIAVKSNLVTECLGNMLVELGRVSSEAFAESVERVKAGEGLQGEILVAMDVLDEDAVAAALREQAQRKLMEVFRWRSGKYQLLPERSIQRANALAVDGSPADIVLVAARKYVPLSRVDRFFAAHPSHFPVRNERPFYRDQSIALDSAERVLLDGIDGTRPLAEFARGTEAVRRTVYALAMIEILELRSEGVRGAQPKRRRVARDAQRAEPDAALREELAATAKRIRGQTHYEILGLATTADDEAVRAAYESMVGRLHPDRHRNASDAVRQLADEILRAVENAHHALKDANSRTRYAESMKAGRREARERAHGQRVLAAESAFQQAEIALRGRDYEGALVLFGRAVEQYPEDGEYHAHYGWCLHLCHPDNDSIAQEAIEHVMRGIKLARDREKPYLYLGRLYKVVGKVGSAEKMFTRAVQINPDCVEALRELRLMNLRREKSKGILTRLWRR